jgi:uncharacterized damage-inducible protein DinB
MSKVPYEEALGDRDPAKVIAKTPRKLMRLLDDLSDEQIEEAPAPGKWNLRELIAHLADCELVWAWRLRYVYGEKNPVVQPFDQDTWAKMYKSYSLNEALGCFKAVRVWNIAFIDHLKDEDAKKVYVHPERGEETLWTLVRIMAGHDLHHLALLDKNSYWDEKGKPLKPKKK